MKLVTIDAGERGVPGAILGSGEVLHLARAALPGTVEQWLPGTLRDILEAGPDGLAVVRGLVDRVEGFADSSLDALRHRGALTGTGDPAFAAHTRTTARRGVAG